MSAQTAFGRLRYQLQIPAMEYVAIFGLKVNSECFPNSYFKVSEKLLFLIIVF